MTWRQLCGFSVEEIVIQYALGNIAEWELIGIALHSTNEEILTFLLTKFDSATGEYARDRLEYINYVRKQNAS